MNRAVRAFLSSLPAIALPLTLWAASAKPAPPRTTGALATSPPLVVVEQRPFISPVSEIVPENIQVPVKGKIEPAEVFWDVPFAVHIPFEIPYNAAFATVCFDPNIFWEEPPRGAAALDQIDKWRQWRIQTHGIYRMDGKRLPDNSVQWEALDNSNKPGLQPCWFNESGPLPVWINATPPPQLNERSYTFMGDQIPYVQRRPFDPPSPHPLALSPAMAGWYVFWAAVQPDTLASHNWPEHLRGKDSLKARIRVHYVVMRGTPPRDLDQYFFNTSLLPYLFSYGKAPPNITNAADRLYRAATVEIPVTVRRDGWVFDRIGVRPKTTNGFPLASNLDDAKQQFVNEVKTESKPGTRSATVRYQRKQYERKEGSLVPTGEEFTAEWTALFPADIRDNHIADAQLEGSATEKIKDKPPADRYIGGFVSQFGVYGIIGPGMKREEFEKSMRDFHASRVSPEEVKSWWFDPVQKDEKGHLPSPARADAWRMRFWSSFANTFFERDRRKLLFENAGSHPVLTAQCGPWEVQAFYRRLKDAEFKAPIGNDSAAATQEVDVSDDYWQWLGEFRDETDEKSERVQEIRFALRALYQQWQFTRARWFYLLAMDMQLLKEDLVPDQAAIGKRTAEVIREQLAQRAGEMNAIRNQQRALIEESNRIMEELFERAGVRSVRYRERHPDIPKLVDHLKDRRDLTKLELYDAAGFYDARELPQLIAQLQFTSTAVNEVARLMQAKMARARAENLEQRARIAHASPAFNPSKPFALDGEVRDAYLESWQTLRALVRDAPNAKEAKFSLQELELKFLGWVVAKLEGERQANLDGLHRYLVERGFSPDDPQHWWDGTWEFVSVWFSSSPVSLGARIKEDPDAVAQLVDTAQMEIAKNQIALFAIQRLRRNGVPLDRMRAITPDELKLHIALQNTQHGDLSDDQARRLAQDIRETVTSPTLGDLRALAEGNAQAFSELFAKTYYEAIDADRNWIERTTDFFMSPVGLLQFFGSGAVVKAGGKWALHSSRIVALQETTTVSEVLLPAARVERIAKALPKPVYEFMTRAALEDAQFLGEIGAFERFLRADVGRTVATMMFYGGLAQVADEHDLPLLKRLINVIGTLGAGDKLHAVLARSGVSPSGLAVKAQKYLAVLNKAEQQLAEADDAIKMLEAIRQRVASAPPGPLRKLTEEEVKQITEIQKKLFAKYYGQKELPPELFALPGTPGLNLQQDQDLALLAATRSLKVGAPKEAEGALAGASKAADRAKSVVAQQKQAVGQAQAALSQADPTPTVVTPVKSLTVKEEIAGGKATYFLPESGYPPTDYGRALQLGDEALQRGNLGQAFRSYQKAKTFASGQPTTEIHGLINERIRLLARANSALIRQRKLRLPQPMREKSNPILPDEEGRLQDLARAGKVHLEQIEGGINAAYVVKDEAGNVLFFFKKPLPTPGIAPDLADSDVPVELAAAALGREVGLNVAASRKIGFVRMKVKDTNGVETVVDNIDGLLFRYVPGKTLWDLGQAEVMAMKSEIARQQVFRVWLADADGHWGNLRVGDDGYLWPIDFGMGHLTRKRAVKSIVGSNFAGPEQQLENAAGFPKLVFQIYKDNPTNAAGVQKYGMMARLEEMMTYEDMRETVEAIKRLAGDESRLRGLLEQSLQNKPMVDEALEVLRERAGVLESVLKKRMTDIRNRTLQARVIPFDPYRRLASRDWRFIITSSATRSPARLRKAA